MTDRPAPGSVYADPDFTESEYELWLSDIAHRYELDAQDDYRCRVAADDFLCLEELQ